MHPKDHPASFLMHREDVKQMRGVPHAHGFQAYSINKKIKMIPMIEMFVI